METLYREHHQMSMLCYSTALMSSALKSHKKVNLKMSMTIGMMLLHVVSTFHSSKELQSLTSFLEMHNIINVIRNLISTTYQTLQILQIQQNLLMQNNTIHQDKAPYLNLNIKK